MGYEHLWAAGVRWSVGFGVLPTRISRVLALLPFAALAADPPVIHPSARGVLQPDDLVNLRPEYPPPAGEQQDVGGRPGGLAVVDADADDPARFQPQGLADGAADIDAPTGAGVAGVVFDEPRHRRE